MSKRILSIRMNLIISGSRRIVRASIRRRRSSSHGRRRNTSQTERTHGPMIIDGGSLRMTYRVGFIHTAGVYRKDFAA